MRLILFSGSHPRHLFVNRELLKHFDETLIIVMEREELLPLPPKNLLQHDKDLFNKHFQNRSKVELKIYGNLFPKQVYNESNVIFIQPNELNTNEIAEKVRQFNADFCFIFGVDLILNPVINELPSNKINLHLGLSPWYKGAATLFWPFYYLQPQFCGITFHQITEKPDAGEIIHQCVPSLYEGDKIHDVGAKCVLKAIDDLHRVISYWKRKKFFLGKKQKTSGRNWRGIDFHPSHLRVIYDLFNDQIVNHYLAGDLEQRKPKLFSCID